MRHPLLCLSLALLALAGCQTPNPYVASSLPEASLPVLPQQDPAASSAHRVTGVAIAPGAGHRAPRWSAAAWMARPCSRRWPMVSTSAACGPPSACPRRSAGTRPPDPAAAQRAIHRLLRHQLRLRRLRALWLRPRLWRHGRPGADPHPDLPGRRAGGGIARSRHRPGALALGRRAGQQRQQRRTRAHPARDHPPPAGQLSAELKG